VAGGEFRAAAANGNLAKVQSLLKDHPDLILASMPRQLEDGHLCTRRRIGATRMWRSCCC
jgi:hypothetical protein